LNLCGLAPGFIQNPAGQRHEPADMVARSKLGHHAAVRLMHRNLGMHRVGEEPPRLAVVQRHAGLVAGGLDPEDQHA
jgi:hypothetical protein